MNLGNLILKYSCISFFIGVISYLPAFFIPVSQGFKLISNYFLLFYPVILLITCIKSYRKRKLLTREKLLLAFSLSLTTTLSIMIIGTLNLAGHNLNEAEERMGGPVGISLHFGFIIFILAAIAGLLTKNKPILNIQAHI